jgi:hypothetical protein
LRKLSLLVVVPLSFLGFLPNACFGQSESILVSTNTDVLAPGAAGSGGSALSDATAATVPEPGAGPKQAGTAREPRVGIGVRVSTLGIGGEVAVRVLNRANVRAGFNLLGFSHSFPSNGIDYSGSLHLRSAEAHFDYFLFSSFTSAPACCCTTVIT